jgi:hypothetical protein
MKRFKVANFQIINQNICGLEFVKNPSIRKELLLVYSPSWQDA